MNDHIRVRECRNPYVLAAHRQHKLMTGGRPLCGSASSDDGSARPSSPFKRPFLNPFLNAAAAKYHLHTGSPFMAKRAAVFHGVAANRGAVEVSRLFETIKKHLFAPLFWVWRNPKFKKVLSWGTLSLTLYALLFINAETVLAASIGHWWSPLVPVVIALVFSLAHGNFTSAFWEAVGLKPNTIRK